MNTTKRLKVFAAMMLFAIPACGDAGDATGERSAEDTAQAVEAAPAPFTQGATLTLTSACSNKVLDVEGARKEDGAGVHLWASHGGDNQRFRVAAVDGGFVELTSVHAGKTLEVDDGARGEGARVQQWARANVAHQQWRPKAVGNGLFELEARHAPGMFLDAKSAGTADGTPVWLWTGNGSCAQRWKVATVGAPAPAPSPNPTPQPGATKARIGINNGTGYNSTPAYVDGAIARMNQLGVKVVRMGVDGVNGRSVGAGFNWAARDYVVDAYRRAGIEVHAVISFRGHVDGGDDATWKRNWENFARNVLTHYRGKLSYYIIDNETDLSYGGGQLGIQEPAKVVDFNRIAFQVARSVDGSIRIESSPATSPFTDYNKRMLDAGLAQYCDVVGTHMYGGQLERADIGILRRWVDEKAPGKPIAISEAGAIDSYFPNAADKAAARADWVRRAAEQAREYKLDSLLLFDWDAHEEWRMEGTPSIEALGKAAREVRY